MTMTKKLGIICSTKFLTVFIKENMLQGLSTERDGIKVTRGKLLGKKICLLEPLVESGFQDCQLDNLLLEYKIGRVISLDVGTSMQQALQNGDIIISSEAQLGLGLESKAPKSKPIRADAKLMDQVLSVFEKQSTEEGYIKAVVGKVISLIKDGFVEQPVFDTSDAIYCLDTDGYYLANCSNRANVPWALIRFVVNTLKLESERLTTSIKWDMAKKCFWIVKAISEEKIETSNLRIGSKVDLTNGFEYN